MPILLKNKKTVLFLICLLALLIRVSFLIVLEPWNEDVVKNKVLIGDSIGYQARAVAIVNDRSISSIDPWWTPGYFFFLSFIYFIFGIKPWLALLAQVLLDTGIVIIAYLTARELFGSETVSLIAAFLYAVSFPSAFYSIRLLSEITFTFALALAVLVFIKGLKQNRPGIFAASGFLLGVAAYVRAVALYFPAALVVVLLFGNNHPILKLRNIVIVLVIFAATLFPWQFRNLKLYGDYAMTTKGGVNLIVNAAIVKAEAENMTWQEAMAVLGESSSANPFEKSKVRQDVALSYISKHPFVFMKCQLRGILKMFLGTGQSGLTYLFGIKTNPSYAMDHIADTGAKVLGNIKNEFLNIALFAKQLIEYFFVIIGLVFMYRKDKKLYLLLFIMTILYFAAVTGPIGYSRFRVPIIPFYLVVSAEGIFEAFRSIGRRYS